MNAVRQLQAYQQNQVATADSGTVLLRLYQGAIDYLTRAKDCLETGDMAEKGRCILRAHDIIMQFQLALDFEVGGELAQTLDGLYSYMLDEIMLGNVGNDPKPLQTVISLLSTLKSGWEEAVVIQRKAVANEDA